MGLKIGAIKLALSDDLPKLGAMQDVIYVTESEFSQLSPLALALTPALAN